MFLFVICVEVKNEKKHIKRKKERNHIMQIVLVGGSNWLGRDLMRKLLSEKKQFHFTWIDNLSSEYSSRHYTWDFEYLKDDCFDFQYGDITSYDFLKSIICKDSIIIYNVWTQPQCVIGMDNIARLSRELDCRLIYTTPKSLIDSFKYIIQKNKLQGVIGIQYKGELVGQYDIFNKRDPIDTIQYYKKIGNKITHASFEYYTMDSAVHFIYFFIIQPMDDNLFIQQPILIYQ